MVKRKKTRQVRIGKVRVGGDAPVSFQSMTKVKASNVAATVAEIRRLERAGCEIIRIAVKDLDDARAVKAIRKRIRIPLVCDIHFDYRLALASIANGADKIRINPGNMRDEDEVVQVLRAAKRAKIPIRIGVNSGSVLTQYAIRNTQYEGASTRLVDAAMKYVKLFEKHGFRDIIISLKASDCLSTIDAYRKVSRLCDYPLHLGVTAAGPHDSGIVKSAIGIGTLLADGIGDTIRVSLTADPVEEVIAAKRILSALKLRRFGPDIISCPTCGRCQVDLAAIVKKLERSIASQGNGLRVTGNAIKSVTIAVMGCEVNGPGEAKEADIGIAFGNNCGMLFKKGKIVRRVKIEDAVSAILKEIR